MPLRHSVDQKQHTKFATHIIGQVVDGFKDYKGDSVGVVCYNTRDGKLQIPFDPWDVSRTPK